MFWLYVPPIIFISALIVLVVIMGKKSAMLGKAGGLRIGQKMPLREGVFPGSRWKYFGRVMVMFLEKLLSFAKNGARKTEIALAGVLSRLRREKSKDVHPNIATKPGRIAEPPVRYLGADEEIDIIPGAVKKNRFAGKAVGSVSQILKEVVVRKRAEPVPQRIVQEIAAEDKLKEEALVHRIAENPKDVEAYRELGDYYMATGNLKDAKDSFKMVLKLRPRDLKAKSSLRDLEMRMRLGA